MDLKGYLIEKYNNMAGAYTARRIMEEAKARGAGLELIGVHDTYISGGTVFNRERELRECDYVINRYKWGRVKDAVNALAKRSYNALKPFNIYINKYEQAKRLTSGNFIMPRCILGTALTDFGIPSQTLGLPFVAKGLESSMGEQIYLIENEEDFRGLKKTHGIKKEWLFQEFIKESRGRDLRLCSIRGEAVAAMIRKASDGFRSNVALGASVSPVDITPEMREIASVIYRETGLDFLGTDLLFGKDGLYLCEINVMPGLEGIEKASGLNIAGMLMDVITGDL